MFWSLLSDAFSGQASFGESRRVLLVEDDFLVGLSIKAMLERLGFEVVGPVASLSNAVETINNESVDAAVLDINIVGGTSVPIAERLRALARPFFFVTGYQSPTHLLPQELQGVRLLNKPVDERSIAAALKDVMG